MVGFLTTSIPWEDDEHFERTTGVPHAGNRFILTTDGLLVTNWSYRTVNGLKQLIQSGADPEIALMLHLDDRMIGSALYVFLSGIDKLIFNRQNEAIFPDLLELMDLMMTDEALSPTWKEEGGRTLLHVLVGKKWPAVKEDNNGARKEERYNSRQLKMMTKVITKFVEKDRVQLMLDTVNILGHTPLHTFIFTAFPALVSNKDPVFAEFICDVILLLKTPTNIELQDVSGSTPLHHAVRNISFDFREANDAAKGMNDKKVTREVVKICCHLINPKVVDMSDKLKRSALQILIKNMFDERLPAPEVSADIQRLIAELKSPNNINIMDEELMSPLSWILWKEKRWSKNRASGDLHFAAQRLFLTRVKEQLIEAGANMSIAKSGLRHK